MLWFLSLMATQVLPLVSSWWVLSLTNTNTLFLHFHAVGLESPEVHGHSSVPTDSPLGTLSAGQGVVACF